MTSTHIRTMRRRELGGCDSQRAEGLDFRLGLRMTVILGFGFGVLVGGGGFGFEVSNLRWSAQYRVRFYRGGVLDVRFSWGKQRRRMVVGRIISELMTVDSMAEGLVSGFIGLVVLNQSFWFEEIGGGLTELFGFSGGWSWMMVCCCDLRQIEFRAEVYWPWICEDVGGFDLFVNLELDCEAVNPWRWCWVSVSGGWETVVWPLWRR